MNWVSVCQVGDVSEDMPKAIEIEGTKIGVFKLEDQLFAIENVCPHAYALLTDGFIEDETVECPLHEAIFEIKTGTLQSGPGCRNLHIYSVKTENGQVLVQYDAK